MDYYGDRSHSSADLVMDLSGQSDGVAPPTTPPVCVGGPAAPHPRRVLLLSPCQGMLFPGCLGLLLPIYMVSLLPLWVMLLLWCLPLLSLPTSLN